MSIGQKLEQVSDLVYEKGYTKGGLDASPQETVSGGIVAITDISPIEHNVEVKASSKNLLPYQNYQIGKRITLYGVTATVNEDGSILMNGTSTSENVVNFYLHWNIPLTLSAGSYIIGGSPSTECYISVYNPETQKYLNTNVNPTTQLDLTKTSSNIKILVQMKKQAVLDNVLVKPFIVKKEAYDGIWTPYIPDVSVATVKVCGKNICDYTKFVGISAVDKANVVLDGDTFIFPAGNGYYGLNMTNGLSLIKGQKYTFSYKAVSNYAYPECQINYTDGTKVIANNGKTVTIENKDIKLINFYIATGQLAETDFKLSKFQVEAGTSVAKYELPKPPTSYPIAADGTVEGVTSIYPNMTIATDTNGVIIEANYYQDGKKVKENLIDMILSLGGVINE